MVSGRDEAANLANTFASEHLHIACAEPEEMLSRIRNAGAVFLGPYSPVALGDYVAGPSHVLPTGANGPFRQRPVVERFSALAQCDSVSRKKGWRQLPTT